MDPDVAFGMELRRLLDTFHALDFQKQFVQQATLVEQLETAASPAFGEDADEFVAHAFRRNAMDLRRKFPNRSKRTRLDGEAEARGEADGAQHPQVILFKAAVGRTDGTDDAGLEIGASAHEV